MKPTAKPTFDDVAKMLADPPPPWLAQGLAFLSGVVRDTGTSDQREEHAAEIDRLRNAIETLRRLLPLFLAMPIGRCPDDVVVVLDALTRVQRMLTRLNLRPGKRTPMFHPKCCAAVIVEASQMVLGKALPRSEVFTYSACEAYWKACRNLPLGDAIENWLRAERELVAV